MDQAEDVPADPEKDDGDAGVLYVQMDLKALEKENPDTAAWLYYPALGINHPVMQDEDNTYYIKHIFSGDKNWIAGDICGCGDIDFFKTNAEGNRKKVSCRLIL